MISLRLLKRWLAALGLAVGLVLVPLVLVTITSVIVHAGSGADPSDAFTPAPVVMANLSDVVDWDQDSPDLLRSIEPTTRLELGAAWVRGLDAASRASKHDNSRGVATWFSGGARERVRALTSEPSDTTSVEWHHHQLHATFVSIDGQVIALEVESLGRLPSPDGGYPIADRYEVVMILRDGNWRIERVTRLPTLDQTLTADPKTS